MNDTNIDREERRFEEMLAAAESQAPPPDPAFLERLKEQSTQAFLAAAYRPPERKQRNIMRSLKTYGLLAAAACILAAIAVTSWRTGKGPDLATNAYAELMQAFDNAAAAEWVHVTYPPNSNESEEEWASFAPFRDLAVQHGRKVVFKDGAAGLRHTYEFATNTITVERREVPQEAKSAGSYLEFLQKNIQKWVNEKDNTVTVTLSERLVDGRMYQVYSIQSEKPSTSLHLGEFLVDPQAKRVVRVVATSTEGAANTIDIDYPETGPADIYFMGFVPRDAIILDKTQGSTSAPATVK